MNRKFRLSKSAEFERVRRSGKSYAHPLIVLVVHENECSGVRIGVTAGRSLGGAVRRNRAKRQMRASMHPFLDQIPPGKDLVWIARRPLLGASFQELQQAMLLLMQRAGLVNNHDR